MKTCSKCGIDKQESEFSKNKSEKDGLMFWCKECDKTRNESRRISQKESYDLKKELTDKLKDKPCADCGIKYPPYVMDFDHVKGKKKFSIGHARHLHTQIMDEVAKCEVVCSNCHRIRTYNRRRQNEFKRSLGSNTLQGAV